MNTLSSYRHDVAAIQEARRRAIGRELRIARQTAGLTQAQLGDKIRRPHHLVSRVETGETAVGEGYVEDVLKACGLPDDWKAPRLASDAERAALRDTVRNPLAFVDAKTVMRLLDTLDVATSTLRFFAAQGNTRAREALERIGGGR